MSDDCSRERAIVSDMYSGPGWKRKVANMSCSQVIAIYKKELAKAEKPKPKEEPKDDIPF